LITADPKAASRARNAELKAAAIKIGVAIIVAGGLFALYAHEVRVEQRVQELINGQKLAGGRAGGARADLNRDTPRGWLAAEDSLGKALELQPSNPYAVAAFADVEVLLAGAGLPGREERAQEAVAKAEARDVSFAERFEARTLQLIQAGKAGEAESYLLAVLQKYERSSPRLFDALGHAQRASGKLAEARASFRKAQDADWRSPRFVADYAQALLEEGSSAEAAAAFDRALQANADHARSQLGKARALVALFRDGRSGGDLKAARSLCDAVLQRSGAELPPQLKASALATRAEVAIAAGDVASAEKDLSAAPETASVLRARALLAAAKKEPGAGAAFKAAAAKDPYDASTCFDGAAALSAAGDAASAERLLGSFAATLPQTARYHLALAQLLARKDDLKAAQAQLQKAQQLEPTNAMVYFEEGRIAQKQKDTKAAVAAYERAAQLRDDFPEVYRQMGSLYLEGKDVQAAIRVFNDALARYKAMRAPPAQLEAFYADVNQQIARAGQKKLAAQWVVEARALH
jgi:tetratricopeptide (TPR) repeat protein